LVTTAEVVDEVTLVVLLVLVAETGAGEVVEVVNVVDELYELDDVWPDELSELDVVGVSEVELDDEKLDELDVFDVEVDGGRLDVLDNEVLEELTAVESGVDDEELDLDALLGLLLELDSELMLDRGEAVLRPEEAAGVVEDDEGVNGAPTA
jgi:hypothetical protein